MLIHEDNEDNGPHSLLYIRPCWTTLYSTVHTELCCTIHGWTSIIYYISWSCSFLAPNLFLRNEAQDLRFHIFSFEPELRLLGSTILSYFLLELELELQSSNLFLWREILGHSTSNFGARDLISHFS